MSLGAAGPPWLWLLEACPPCLGEGYVPGLGAVLEVWRPWVGLSSESQTPLLPLVPGARSLCCLMT